MNNRSSIVDNFKSISKEIQSQYQDGIAFKKIPAQILDMHLPTNHPCLQFYNNSLRQMIPYWQIDTQQFIINICNILSRKWNFSNTNKSCILIWWGPFSNMLFSHMIVDEPYTFSQRILIAGAIHLVLIFLTGFIMYVFCNYIQTPYKSFIEHLNFSSFLGILTLIYSIIAVGCSPILVLLLSIAFMLVGSYLHFVIYNQATKPTLLQMLSLIIIILIMYASAGISFYQIYTHPRSSNPLAIPIIPSKTHNNFMQFRSF